MKTTENNSHYIRMSPSLFVFWIILISVLYLKTLHAQDINVYSKNLDDPNAPTPSVSAQTDTTRKLVTKRSYWCDLGSGWGGQGTAFNIGFSYEITPKRIMSIHYSGVITRHRYYDYFLFFPTTSYPSGEDAEAFEITYGFLKKGKAGIMNFSAGLSSVKIQSGTGKAPPIRQNGLVALFFGSNLPADYELRESTTIGLALRAQFIPSLRWAGLGISPYVNINPDYTFASISFQLLLGRIRPKVRKVKQDLLRT